MEVWRVFILMSRGRVGKEERPNLIDIHTIPQGGITTVRN